MLAWRRPGHAGPLGPPARPVRITLPGAPRSIPGSLRFVPPHSQNRPPLPGASARFQVTNDAWKLESKRQTAPCRRAPRLGLRAASWGLHAAGPLPLPRRADDPRGGPRPAPRSPQSMPLPRASARLSPHAQAPVSRPVPSRPPSAPAARARHHRPAGGSEDEREPHTPPPPAPLLRRHFSGTRT